MIEHGTVRGYRAHQARGHRGVEIDNACRSAWNTYCADWQRRNYDPEKRRRAYHRRRDPAPPAMPAPMTLRRPTA